MKLEDLSIKSTESLVVGTDFKADEWVTQTVSYTHLGYDQDHALQNQSNWGENILGKTLTFYRGSL